jgi:cytochrome c553
MHRHRFTRTVIILLSLPAFFAIAQAASEGLSPPPGYKPDKKLVRLFDAKCATCHGEDGKAKTLEGREMGIADMTKAAYWKDLTVEKARKSVEEGIKRTHNGKEQEMKPFKGRLTTEQIDALNIYASSLKK